MSARNPFEGIEHYDLKRLTQGQAAQLDDILKKTRNGMKLNTKDLDALGGIRRAVKCKASEAPKRSTDPIDGISASLRQLTDLLK
jgi:hypothetical protein